MKNSKILTAILEISGLISVIVGIGMLFFPTEFHASAGIVLDGGVNLTNEMRAAGGPLLVGGVIIALGAFVERLKFAATLMASVFCLSYGGARIVSIVMDGMPSSGLIRVTVLELLVGAFAAAALFFFSKRETH
jgi:hypothetical protein